MTARKDKSSSPGHFLNMDSNELIQPQALLSLFDQLPRVYLYIKDISHRFVKVNRGLLELHGFAHETEMLGKTDFDISIPALAAQYIEEDDVVFQSGQPLSPRPWLVVGADGLPQWYLSTKLPLFNAAGAVIGLAGVMYPYDHAEGSPGGYQRLTGAMNYVLQHYGERLELTAMAAAAHLSVRQLHRDFQRLFHMSPGDYILRVRLMMARRELEQSSTPIGRIALECGFYDQSHFTRAFRSQTGLSPRAYRKRLTTLGD